MPKDWGGRYIPVGSGEYHIRHDPDGRARKNIVEPVVVGLYPAVPHEGGSQICRRPVSPPVPPLEKGCPGKGNGGVPGRKRMVIPVRRLLADGKLQAPGNRCGGQKRHAQLPRPFPIPVVNGHRRRCRRKYDKPDIARCLEGIVVGECASSCAKRKDDPQKTCQQGFYNVSASSGRDVVHRPSGSFRIFGSGHHRRGRGRWQQEVPIVRPVLSPHI